MAEVKVDIIEGHRVRKERGVPVELTRRFWVKGINGAASKRAYDLTNAPGIPQYPAAHPTIVGLFVEAHDANRMDGADSGFVDVIYRRPEGGAVPEDADGEVAFRFTNGGGGFQQVASWRDVNGDEVTVMFNGVTKPAQGTRFVGQVSIAGYEVVETTTPGTRLATYNGKLSQGVWQGFPEKSWLCRGRMTNLRDNLWRFDWEWLLNESTFGWNDEVFFLDENGVAILAAASKEFAGASTVNFSSIGGQAA